MDKSGRRDESSCQKVNGDSHERIESPKENQDVDVENGDRDHDIQMARAFQRNLLNVRDEIMEKLSHGNNTQYEPTSTTPHQSNHFDQRQLRPEADPQQFIVDAAALQAAALKFKFPSPYYSVPAIEMLHRDGFALSAQQRMELMNQISLPFEMNRMAGKNIQSTANTNGDSSCSPPSDENEEMEALNGADDDSSPQGSAPWTYEEQFKQLYEMGNEPDRKAFLDELFQFMQRKGSPVNRIPIMAKQTLDIYLLFKLVVNKGGLVEVINKKLWREITKGLNLPSSITSAAFTLRTQYMKFLYPYECEKYNFSTPSELQSAIDGNRREGRRTNYDINNMNGHGLSFPFYGSQNLANSPFFNPSLLSNPMMNVFASPIGASFLTNGPTYPVTSRINGQSSNHERDESSRYPSIVSTPTTARTSGITSVRVPNQNEGSVNGDFIGAKRSITVDSPESPSFKRDRKDSLASESNSEVRTMERQCNGIRVVPPISTTDMKLYSGRGENGEKSMIITMDVNGTTYHGVLYEKLH